MDRQIVDRLKQDGHTVPYLRELQPGIPDDAVLDLTTRQAAVLITSDKDFGELVFRHHRVTSGVVLVRLAGLSQERKADIVAAAVREHGTELADSLTVIGPGAVRIRRRI